MVLSDTEPSKKRRVIAAKANKDSDSEAPPKKRSKAAKPKIAGTKKNAEDVLAKRQGGTKKPLVLNEQNRFIVECYDNRTPSLSRTNIWEDVQDKFNEHFRDEIKRPLAWKTLERRYSEAKKLYDAERVGYDTVVQYPLAQAQVDEDGEKAEIDLVEDVGNDLDNERVAPNLKENEAALTFSLRPAVTPSHKKPPKGEPTSKLPIQASAGTHPAPEPHASNWIDEHPGASIPSAISAAHIPPLSRIKFHLRTRSDELATFAYSPLTNEEDTSVEHSILYFTSPFYVRFSRDNPAAPLPVPEHFCLTTVKTFVQLISPERATSLPTHYLWTSEEPVAGVYDRFGAIEVEKIHWIVETLLELYGFARWMEVFWIGDMVIDRLHWIFLTQKKLKDVCAGIDRKDGAIDLGDGEKRFFGSRLPYVANLEDLSLAVEDFKTVWLTRLGTAPVDAKMMAFIADIMRALGGGPNKKWLSKAPKAIQTIFALSSSSSSSSQSPLKDGAREDFCSAYHHHGAEEACYTAVPQQRADNYFIHKLYATSSRDELLTLSEGVAPPMELESIIYAASATPQKLKSANSSTEMLEAEKMVLEIEMRLERAKMALAKARGAGKDEKERLISDAKHVAKGMFSGTSVL